MANRDVEHKPQSLAAAIAFGESVFQQVLESSKAYPKLCDVPRGPGTWSDAQAVVQQREEKKKKDLKSKSVKTASVLEQPFTAPTGSLIGAVGDQSALWMFMEDYFRDVAQEDLLALIPKHLDPCSDDALAIPHLGRDLDHGDKATASKPTFPKQQPKPEPSDDSERRSSRLSHMAKQDEPGAHDNTGDTIVGSPQANSLLAACLHSEVHMLGKLLGRLGLTSSAPHDVNAGPGPPSSLLHHALPPLTATPEDDGDTLKRDLMLIQMLAGLQNGSTLAPDAASELKQHSRAPEAQQQALSPTAVQAAPSSTPVPSSAPAADSTAGVPEQQEPHPKVATAAPATSQPNILAGDFTELGEFLHPYTQLMLARPPTAYVLDPMACLQFPVDPGDDLDLDALSATAIAPDKPARQVAVKTEPPTSTPTSPPATQPQQAPQPLQLLTPAPKPNPAQETALDTAQASQQAAAAAAAAAQQPAQAAPASAPAATPAAPAAAAAVDGPPADNPVASPDPSPTPTAAASMPGQTDGPGKAPNDDESAHDKDKSAGRGSGRARASINYSLLAGKKDHLVKPPSSVKLKKVHKPKPKVAGSVKGAMAAQHGPEASSNPVAIAMAALIAAGPLEGSIDDQWQQLEAATDLMSTAPDDEVLAELLALQSELLQQVAINRQRAAVVLLRALQELPAQQQATAERKALEEEIKAYMQRKAELKRNQKREKREQEKRLALAAVEAGPSPSRPRPKALSADGTQEPEDGSGVKLIAGAGPASPAPLTPVPEPMVPGEPLIDPLAHRHEEDGGDDACCAICADGQSIPPNEIVFCERCNVPVHQFCYGVTEIPSGEWLCWPCMEHERDLRISGMPQSQIRPPRWELSVSGAQGQLEGGSLSVDCCLCPVKHGAFKRTVDDKDWVHVVCGLWHPETNVLPGNICEAVAGVKTLKSDKFQTRCSVCHQVSGAVIKCNYGHCQAHFHPLCARRAGFYIPAKWAPGGKIMYRAYCGQHSDMLRQRDLEAGVVRGQIELVSKPKKEAVLPKKVKAEGPGKLKAAGAVSKAKQAKAKAGAGGIKAALVKVSAKAAAASAAAAGVGPALEGEAAAAEAAGEEEEGEEEEEAALLAEEAEEEAAEKAAAKAAQRAAREAAAAAAASRAAEEAAQLQALAAKEQDAHLLKSVRYELETMRLITDQVRKREKLKRLAVKQLEDIVCARRDHPHEALHVLQELGADLSLPPEPAPPPKQQQQQQQQQASGSAAAAAGADAASAGTAASSQQSPAAAGEVAEDAPGPSAASAGPQSPRASSRKRAREEAEASVKPAAVAGGQKGAVTGPSGKKGHKLSLSARKAAAAAGTSASKPELSSAPAPPGPATNGAEATAEPSAAQAVGTAANDAAAAATSGKADAQGKAASAAAAAEAPAAQTLAAGEAAEAAEGAVHEDAQVQGHEGGDEAAPARARSSSSGPLKKKKKGGPAPVDAPRAYGITRHQRALQEKLEQQQQQQQQQQEAGQQQEEEEAGQQQQQQQAASSSLTRAGSNAVLVDTRAALARQRSGMMDLDGALMPGPNTAQPALVPPVLHKTPSVGHKRKGEPLGQPYVGLASIGLIGPDHIGPATAAAARPAVIADYTSPAAANSARAVAIPDHASPAVAAVVWPAAAVGGSAWVGREVMMTPGEADTTNTKLPKGYKYVRAEDVPQQNLKG